MKIKKEFLNEESLKPYGFEKDVIYEADDGSLKRYVWKNAAVEIDILDYNRMVRFEVKNNYSCATIPNAIYNLIKDGLAEPDEPEKMTLSQVCKLLGKEIEIIN